MGSPSYRKRPAAGVVRVDNDQIIGRLSTVENLQSLAGVLNCSGLELWAVNSGSRVTRQILA